MKTTNAPRIDPPSRMHCKTIGIDGSPEWSPKFLRYIGNLVVSSIIQERLEWLEWWRTPYVVQRMKARFGDAIIDATIAMERSQVHAHFVAPQFHVSVSKLERIQRRTRRIARETYFPRADMPRY